MKTLAVIYNHNHPEITDQLFETLYNPKNVDYDLIVLDNGSREEGKSKYTTYETGQNTYFGGALNLAMQLVLENSQYDSLLSLNNDLFLHGPNFVSALRKVMFEEDYKIISPCVLQAQKNQVKWKYMHCWASSTPRTVKWVDFQAPLIHRDFIEHIQQFSLDLIYGWGQDIYSGIVCEENNWKVGVLDWVPVIHYSAQTYKDGRSDIDLHTYCRNAEYGMKKFFEEKNIIQKVNNFRQMSSEYSYE